MTGSLHQPAPDEALASPPAIAPPLHSPQGLNWAMGWVLIASCAAILSTCVLFFGGGKRGFFLTELAMVVSLVAAFTDAHSGRIPNAITYPAVLAGLLLNTLAWLFHLAHWDVAATWLGSPGILPSLAGFGACLVLGLAAALIGQVHGGDLKLLCAVGAIIGITGVVNVLLFTLALGLIYSIINLFLRGKLVDALRLAANRMMEWYFLRQFKSSVPEVAPHSPLHFPLGIPLALGLILTQYWQWHMGETLL